MKIPFDFRQWVFLINGVPLVEFAAGDDAFEMDRNEDSFSTEFGVTGEMTASLSANRGGKVTFKLAANSRSNTFLGTLMDLQEGGALTFIPVRFAAKDQNLQDAGAGTVGVLSRPSKVTRGGKPGDQEWSIMVEKLDMVFGGALDLPL